MAFDQENKDLAQRVNDFLAANRKIVLAILGCIVVIIIAVIGGYTVSEKLHEKAISEVERVIYDLEEFKLKNKADSEEKKNEEVAGAEEKNDDASKDDTSKVKENISEEIKTEEDKAIEKLLALTAKGSASYAAFRANTAIAEIYFQRKSYEDALKYYELAAVSVKNSYTTGVAYFNAASCADELGNNEKALEFYEKASKVENFPLIPRALFNTGRIYEAMLKKDEAIAYYNKLLEAYPNNEWALLGKSRIFDISKDS